MRIKRIFIMAISVATLAIATPTLAAQDAYLHDLAPGPASKELKILFDTGVLLVDDGGVNKTVKAVIPMEIKGVAPVQVDTAYMIDATGTRMGQNMATTLALEKDKLISFSFEARDLTSEEVRKVAGITLTFKNRGESYQKVTIHVASGQAFMTEDVGECVPIDDTVIKAAKPIARTIDDVRNEGRKITRGDSGTVGGSGGGGGGAASATAMAGSGATVGSGSCSGNWTSVNNITLQDGVYTSVTCTTAPATTPYLEARTFGFSVPSTASIDGIRFSVGTYTGNPGDIKDSGIRIQRGAALGSENKALANYWGAGETKLYGGSSDKWSEAWTISEINDSSFGLNIAVTMVNFAGTASVDYVSSTVYYTTASGSIYDAFTDLIYTLSKKAYCLVTHSPSCLR